MKMVDEGPKGAEFGAAPPEGWQALEVEMVAHPSAAIGLIALANDCNIERDVHGFLTVPGISVHTNRVYSPRYSNLESLHAVQADISSAVAGLMPDDHLDVVAFGCTSATMALGADAVVEAVRSARPGVQVADPITAGLAGLARLDCRRIALITPYIGEVNVMVENYIRAQGFDVRACGFFPVHDDNERSRVTSGALEAGVQAVGTDSEVEAVFVSCTALQTAPAVGRLEQILGKPVVTSNQALAWQAMRLAGDLRKVTGRGRLFAL